MIDLFPKPKSPSRLRVAVRCYLNPTFVFISSRFARRATLLCWSIPALWHFSLGAVRSYRVAHGRPLERVRGRMKILGSNVTACLYEAWFEINRMSDLSSHSGDYEDQLLFYVMWHRVVWKVPEMWDRNPDVEQLCMTILAPPTILVRSVSGEGYDIIIIGSSSSEWWWWWVAAVITELPARMYAYTTSLEPECCTLQKIESFTFKPCHIFCAFMVTVC